MTSGVSRRTVIAGLAFAPALLRAQRARPDPVIACRAGRFRGKYEAGAAHFLGIRYGQAGRFLAPLRAPRDRETFNAWFHGTGSPQARFERGLMAEDCLYLNIWMPDAATEAARPVMVYLHGGAYSSGTASDSLLWGRNLAVRGDVVVVTLTHRLNAFGYLHLAPLDPRFPDSGNAGQLDLILALEWVRDNIAAFDGDPTNVTLFGQSGGGAKIATLMGMPAADRLFHRAATMSGQQVTVSGPQHALERTRAYMAALGARSVDDLLALPVERLVEGLAARDPILGGSLYFGPVLDMKWLVRHPFWPDANPQSDRIPMLMGNTHDETRAFFPPGHPVLAGLTWDNLPERIGPELRIDAPPGWVVAEYRRLFAAYSPEQIFFAATTASRSWRAQVIEAEARAAAGAPAFVYQLDTPHPAPHMADIPLVFSGAGAVADAFLRFARTGAPGWPAYTLPERRTMVFDTESRVVSDPRRAEREIFARFPYIQPGT